MSLAMISKNLWEKYKMKFLFLKQEVVFFLLPPEMKVKEYRISLVSYLEVEF